MSVELEGSRCQSCRESRYEESWSATRASRIKQRRRQGMSGKQLARAQQGISRNSVICCPVSKVSGCLGVQKTTAVDQVRGSRKDGSPKREGGRFRLIAHKPRRPSPPAEIRPLPARCFDSLAKGDFRAPLKHKLLDESLLNEATIS